MSDHNTAEIFAAARIYDLDIPAEVVTAEAALVAAQQQRDAIANETAPDYSTATDRNVAKLLEAGIRHAQRDDRLAVAEQILGAARERHNTATFVTAQRLAPRFADLFNEAAEAFAAAHAALDGLVSAHAAAANPDAHTERAAAADRLDQLRKVRNAFAPIGSRAEVAYGSVFEEISRCLVIPDKNTLRLHRPSGAGVDYWAAAIEAGYVIRWQDREAQEANDLAMRSVAVA